MHGMDVGVCAVRLLARPVRSLPSVQVPLPASHVQPPNPPTPKLQHPLYECYHSVAGPMTPGLPVLSSSHRTGHSSLPPGHPVLGSS